MNELKYECLKCGICCFEISGNLGAKRIPLYPEEVAELIKKAKERDLNFKVMEDLVFPDILNQKILIITYKIMLEDEAQCCPFYKKACGCSIHEIKPLACQAYPLSLQQLDAFNFKISIDPLCKFVSTHYNELQNSNLEILKKIFSKEYPKAERFFRKNKKIQLEIRKLEAEKKIQIPRKIDIQNYNNFLKEWERKEIIV